ncbi:hypothetical protein HBI82_035270 [Parastagonospora nodorum]|nr:hypothetical protein HBH46_068860 [Parastagonospora nodorum]KAH5781494.1 hypothetical protein HBI97_102650 [Parastagonospora nodorum]KAH5823237.1 hypothetical protein HBI96_034260 [Parastagonospora nodorum]KAH5836069.1 hypothetical protein HBI94_003480 [Parastagonospora nodorum]KAH5841404.1 hypothetical protein HBI93_028030 [Parastagonospora nodorum]
MNHIANCMRPDGERTPNYITQETSFFRMSATEDTITSSNADLTKSPSLANLNQPTTLSSSRYQLWPSSRSPQGQIRNNSSFDKLSALSVGRSSTSLSDTAVLPESVPFWQRTSALARRRKVSVPELGNTMTTVQEMAVDSPTIPGRPPLRQLSYEAFGHERSCSAPGTNWRAGPFGDAMVSCVTGPSPGTSSQQTTPAFSDTPKASAKPLSPIISPITSPKPLLKVDTTNFGGDLELPPQVPPKSPTVERKGSPTPLVLNSKASRTQLMTPASVTSGGNTPLSAADTRRSPNAIPLPTPPTTFINPFSTASPASSRGSPRVERRDPILAVSSSHNRNMSESSVMDRGRPSRRNSSKRQRDRAMSEAQNAEPPTPDPWQLPHGMRVPEASRRMSDADKSLLHKQAYDQAGNFEVLNKRDVASLSRELRALDERCDYLRKTYKSLRAGRQKLHGRMISYLRRGETVIFSRESLLKQEEALAELDVSIDEFILKLEQAENRRLRLRQKLLEHVAAAIVLNPSAAREDIAQTTPPRSPTKVAVSPSAGDRKTTESIKIYADGHVLNLFSDIEKAIGKMCEQTC